jgi:hypothetical protein
VQQPATVVTGDLWSAGTLTGTDGDGLPDDDE